MEESKKKSDFFAIFMASLRENRSKMFFYFELSLVFLFWIISSFFILTSMAKRRNLDILQ